MKTRISIILLLSMLTTSLFASRSFERYKKNKAKVAAEKVAPPDIDMTPKGVVYDMIKEGATGINGVDCSDVWIKIINQSQGRAVTIIFQGGKYFTFDKPNLPMHDSIYMIGDSLKRPIINWDKDYQGVGDWSQIFFSIGNKEIKAKWIKFTSTCPRPIGALFQFNSHPNVCPGISFEGCIWDSMWAWRAVNFGNAAAGETFHKILNPLFYRDTFSNICDPKFPIVYNMTDPKCDAINFEQTMYGGEINKCGFYKISGHPFFQYGYTVGTIDTIAPLNSGYGNLWVHNTTFDRFWMIEVNGGGLGRGLRFTNNVGKNWTSIGGYFLSSASYGYYIDSNRAEGYNTAYELRGIGGRFGNKNKTDFYPASNFDGGIESGANISVIEQYGFNDTIAGEFNYHFPPDTKKRLSGIQFVGINTEARPGIQPESWNGDTHPGHMIVRNFTLTGNNYAAFFSEILVGRDGKPNYFIDINIKPTVTIKPTTLRESSLIAIRWMSGTIEGTYDMSNAVNPGWFAVIDKNPNYNLPGPTQVVVKRLTIYNPAWSTFKSTELYKWAKPLVKASLK